MPVHTLYWKNSLSVKNIEHMNFALIENQSDLDLTHAIS